MDVSILEVEQLTKAFGSVVAVREVTFRLPANEIVGIIGPNGSGKSTMLHCLTGVLRPDSGRVRFEGRDITRHSLAKRATSGIVRTFQNLRLLEGLTVRENIVSAVATRRMRVRSVVAAPLDLADELGLADVLDRTAGSLSYHQRKKLELCRALAASPRLLVLDEPAASLAEDVKIVLARLLTDWRERTDMTTVIVEHDVGLLTQVSDRMIALVNGELVFDGEPAECLSQPIVVSSYLGNAHAVPHG